MGLPRRAVSYSQPSYVPLERVAFVGAILVLVALAALVAQLWVSIRHREENRVFVGDPWDGRSLEWSLSAPPPEYNFALTPVVGDRDAFTLAKERGEAYRLADAYTDIELPKNSALGPVFGAVGLVLAFGLVWHIWWLVILSALTVLVTLIASGFSRDTTRVIHAQEVRQDEERWIGAARAATAISRADECDSRNAGLAVQEQGAAA